EDVRLDGSRGGEVHDVDLARLPDAVQAPDALLDHHRVPGQVEVHEHVAELEVAAFAAGSSGDQDARLVLLERADALVTLRGRVRTPVDDRRATERADLLLDALEGRSGVADDRSSVWRLLKPT